MARLTRNSYKRKIIVFGLLVFMSIALISTGFAAWIMSQEAKVESPGNVSVGVVDDSRITFENVKYEMVILGFDADAEEDKKTYQLTGNDYSEASNGGLRFAFEPRYGDKKGSIQWDGVKYQKPTEENGNVELFVNCEILKLDVSGYITNHTLLANGEFTVNFVVTESVKNCIDNKYIVLKDFGAMPVKDEKTGNYTYTRQVKPDNNGFFSYSVEFEWGEKFNGKNPSLSTDEATITNTELDVIKKNLEDFRAYLLDYYTNGFECTFKEKDDQGVEQDVKEILKGLSYYNDEIAAKEAAINNLNEKDSDYETKVATLLEEIAALRVRKNALILNAADNNKYQLVMIATNGD